MVLLVIHREGYVIYSNTPCIIYSVLDLSSSFCAKLISGADPGLHKHFITASDRGGCICCPQLELNVSYPGCLKHPILTLIGSAKIQHSSIQQNISNDTINCILLHYVLGA